MRVIDQEELAKLLHSTFNEAVLPSEDAEALGLDPAEEWHEEPEWRRDDYRRQADLILRQARVAVKPTPEPRSNVISFQSV